MKKFLVSAAAAGLMLGGAGLAHAAPGPNGHNDYGLCQAYQSGSPTGQAHKHNAPPFVALAKAADQAGNNDGTTTDQEIQSFCDSTTPGGK